MALALDLPEIPISAFYFFFKNSYPLASTGGALSSFLPLECTVMVMSPALCCLLVTASELGELSRSPGLAQIDLGGWAALGDRGLGNPRIPHPPPPAPRRANLSLSVLLAVGSGPLGSPHPLSLIHPSFPSSSPALLLSPWLHCSTMVWQLSDSMTHSLPASRCSAFSLKHTGPQHFHTVLTPGAPQPLTTLTASKAGAHTLRSAS